MLCPERFCVLLGQGSVPWIFFNYQQKKRIPSSKSICTIPNSSTHCSHNVCVVFCEEERKQQQSFLFQKGNLVVVALLCMFRHRLIWIGPLGPICRTKQKPALCCWIRPFRSANQTDQSYDHVISNAGIGEQKCVVKVGKVQKQIGSAPIVCSFTKKSMAGNCVAAAMTLYQQSQAGWRVPCGW